MNIGLRDAILIDLREATFGSRLAGLATCPSCGERLDVTIDLDDLPARRSALQPAGPDETRLLTVSKQGYEVEFRLPNSHDLVRVSGLEQAEDAHRFLLEACVISARRDGVNLPPAALPDGVVAAVDAEMLEVDPLAKLVVSLSCPVCQHRWPMLFDIVSYFWSEIQTWAGRLLREVHQLASAYGWPESDILQMSAWRRRRYLELIYG